MTLRWRVVAVLAALTAVAACGPFVPVGSQPGPTGIAATTARLNSPAVGHKPGPGHVYGVLVDLLSDPATYTISLVSWNGSVGATVKAKRRSPLPGAGKTPLELPYVSTTSDALFYLDGDQVVREVKLDGLQAVAEPVTKLQVGAGAEAVFAVSPDDTQIAVSVIDFNRSPAHVLLYTDTLAGGNPHVIFESDTDYVWPVAWRHGLLVLAHGWGVYLEDALKAGPGQDNPYWAISYHVVDPSNAYRKVLVGEACTVSGPLSPSGSACIQGGSVDWTGANTDWSTYDWGSISSAAALSPDGSYVAAAQPDDDSKLAFYEPGGGIRYYVAGPGRRDWAGWLDNTHLVVGSAIDPNFQTRVVTMTAITPALTYPTAKGFYAARLPTDIV